MIVDAYALSVDYQPVEVLSAALKSAISANRYLI
jgi:hypothetical protein